MALPYSKAQAIHIKSYPTAKLSVLYFWKERPMWYFCSSNFTFGNYQYIKEIPKKVLRCKSIWYTCLSITPVTRRLLQQVGKCQPRELQVLVSLQVKEAAQVLKALSGRHQMQIWTEMTSQAKFHHLPSRLERELNYCAGGLLHHCANMRTHLKHLPLQGA